MKTGTIRFFNERKGFGYIKNGNSPQEIFVHVNNLLEEVREDDEVVFEIVEGRKGLSAVNVKRA